MKFIEITDPWGNKSWINADMIVLARDVTLSYMDAFPKDAPRIVEIVLNTPNQISHVFSIECVEDILFKAVH